MTGNAPGAPRYPLFPKEGVTGEFTREAGRDYQEPVFARSLRRRSNLNNEQRKEIALLLAYLL